MILIGKIAFNPKEVLGHGSEGTFVYRFVSLHMTCFLFILAHMECKDDVICSKYCDNGSRWS